MSDNETKNQNGKLAAPKKLQLTKTVESGKVQQTFSRGRSKTVTVEIKRTRTFSRDVSGKMRKESRISSPQAEPNELDNTDIEESGTLTNQEKEKRLKVLENAKLSSKDDPATVQGEEATENIASTDTLETTSEQDDTTAESTTSSTDASINGAVKKKKSTLTIIENAPKVEQSAKKESQKSTPDFTKHNKEAGDKKTPEVVKKTKAVRDGNKRRTKLTISNAFDQDERIQSLAAVKRRRQKAKRQNETHASMDSEKMVREIILPETISVVELANRLAARVTDVIKELMKLGIMATANQVIDADTAEIVVGELGHTVRRVSDADVEDILKPDDVPEADLITRAPVVTIMGHVDHGKTSLLDALRNANVTEGEAGGITQHIGAYQVTTENGEKVTFLDTPGHAAFTAMRKRGANVTDIVVLIVAADDGVMPQTIEAISHAKAAEVPIIVAINKIDKPDANPAKVKNELLQHELIPEDLGGDVQVIEVSAKSKLNLDKLIEGILLQAEILELKSSPKSKATGSVVESELNKNKGVVATILVQHGTLRDGDIVVAGCAYGKVKTITNDQNKRLKEAGPSLPVEILGLSECPSAGDDFAVCDTEKQARDIVEFRRKRDLEARSVAKIGATDEESLNLLFQSAAGGQKELRLIVKGDVQGSIEAIMGSLEKLNNDEVTVKFIHHAAGGVSESDIQLASAVGASIVGFNVRASAQAKQLAVDENIDIRYYSIIYNLIDDMKAAIGGMMSPVMREEYLGTAEIQQVFKMSKYGKVAGCLVKDGNIKRGAGVRLIRDDIVIHEGKLKVLKRFKEDVLEVRDNTECGMQFENYEDIKEGDKIEAFNVIEEVRVIE